MTTLQKIVVNYNNDEVATVPITEGEVAGVPQPYDITGQELDFFIKPSQSTPDTDASVIKLSTTSGEVVITDGPGGICQVSIDHSHLQTPGTLYWRIDVVTGGTTRNTAGYGPFDVTAM